MTIVPRSSGGSLSLLTDLYQLTMAYGYWKSGQADTEAVFHLHFRNNPFGGGYAIACGLGYAIDFLRDFRFDDSDLAYLATLTGNDGRPLFEPAFLDYLRRLRLSCDLDAMPEGTVVFPHEPLVRVQGPIIEAQILETPLLNMINFQTLIATKAARVCAAAGGDPVLEFGLRRAQGIDGGLAASRAAFVGGCAATSNLLAGKLFGIPVRGTHAHSWVMCFDSELESFETYAAAMPNNCVFLVDTYETLEGVRRAVAVGRRLRDRGHEMVGVRLDSGDLAALSIAARKILDAGGFPNAAIVASNDLDEHLVADLKRQGATIGVWGVGTRLATAYDQPALGGVYKLSAVRPAGGRWQYKVKLSEQAVKTSCPGIQQVRRYTGDAGAIADVIYDLPTGIAEPYTVTDLAEESCRREITASAASSSRDLLVGVFRAGRLVYESPSVAQCQQTARSQIAEFPNGVLHRTKAQRHLVGLEPRLAKLRNTMIQQAKTQ
jgi:nicotinate phosphoribosyltransferase